MNINSFEYLHNQFFSGFHDVSCASSGSRIVMALLLEDV